MDDVTEFITSHLKKHKLTVSKKTSARNIANITKNKRFDLVISKLSQKLT
jgi:hypothetical protein